MPRLAKTSLAFIALLVAAQLAQMYAPATLFAVTTYKATLLTLGGSAGYWLDRALFPYARPHILFEQAKGELAEDDQENALVGGMGTVAMGAAGAAMLRRAIIVAACMVCVGLGA